MHLLSEKFIIFVARTQQQVRVEWKPFTRCCQRIGETA